MKRTRALAERGTWARIEPVVRLAGRVVAPLMSSDLRARVDRLLTLAGDWLGLWPEDFVGLSVVSAVVCGNLGLVLTYCLDGGPIVPIAMTCAGAALPYVAVTNEASRRLRHINRTLPYAIDLMALAMSAGLDFPAAVGIVIDKSEPSEPLVDELAGVLHELYIGRTRRQALERLEGRAPVPSVVELVTALVQAEEKGNPVAEALMIQASVSRTQRSAAAEQAAARAGAALLVPLILLFGAVMLLVAAPMVFQVLEVR